MSKLSWCISTHNNLDYLKLAIRSIEENAFYKDSPIIIYAENCTDGTDEYLKSKPNVTSIVDHHKNLPNGIGGGINIAVSHVKTPLVSILHSDMVISSHYDEPLVKEVESSDVPLVACAYRAEPNIWKQPDRLGTVMVPVDTVDGFGLYHHDFKYDEFNLWANEFVKQQPPIRFRKVEGVSYIMKKCDWDHVGGNSDWTRPSSYDDHDLSVKWTCEGYDFLVTSEAVVWHFGSRGSIFMGQSDKLTGRSERQTISEINNYKKWLKIWGSPPVFDDVGFVKVTDDMREIYKKNKDKFRNGDYSGILS